MDLETFKKLSDFFPMVKNIYLSGWGEPLLNPHFFEMVKLAKKAGCNVGFTTNGALLDNKTIRDLVKDQVDLVSISLGGATQESHESKRVGSHFKKVNEKLALLNSIKIESRSEKPRILLLFMMFKENLNELANVVTLAADLKADGIVATNLDYVGHPSQDELRAFSCTNTIEESIVKIIEAQELAEKRNIYFKAFPLQMNPVQVCSEDPLNNLYISEKGDVSPCVYLNLPLDTIPRIFCNEKTKITPLTFGNIKENTLLKIWKDKEYVSFRENFDSRKMKANSAPLPESCKTCYKAYGI